MSLDTLFTEAAEAGGPPRFTEDDIAARVRTRHRRRRGLVTAGAAVVVVLFAGLGLLLAARGGDDAAPIAPPHEVPITEQALVGSRWVQVTEPDVTGEVSWLEFGADGQARAEGCGNGNGTWSVADGELSLGLRRSTLDLCLPHDAAYAGEATLTSDGVLQFTADPEAPDLEPGADGTVELQRVDSIGAAPTDAEQLLGTWILRPSVEIEFTNQYVSLVGGCLIGEWHLDDGALDTEPAPFDLDCGATLPGAVRDEVDDWLTSIRSGRIDGDRLLLSSPDASIWLRRADATAAPVELADTRWVRAPEEVDSVPQASSITFGEGTYRMAVTCGTVDGDFTHDGATVTMTLTDSDLGPACDVFYPDNEVDHAVLDGDRLTVHLLASANVPDGVDLTREYVRFDQLPVPTEEDLVGSWESPLVGSTLPVAFGTFDEDGTLRFGSCAESTDWSLSAGVLRFEIPEVSCDSYGLGTGPHEFDVRIVGDLLYAADNDVVSILTRGTHGLPDSLISGDGPAQALGETYAAMGVDPCCQVDGDGLTRRGFVWEGADVGVDAVLVWDGLPELGLDGPELVLDERAMSGRSYRGPEVVFDCGGYRLNVYAWDTEIAAGTLLDATAALIDTLPCEASAPS